MTPDESILAHPRRVQPSGAAGGIARLTISSPPTQVAGRTNLLSALPLSTCRSAQSQRPRMQSAYHSPYTHTVYAYARRAVRSGIGEAVPSRISRDWRRVIS